MAKFSVGGDDDGEGPSNPTQKRRRIAVSRAIVGHGERHAIGNPCGTEDEREDIVQGLEVLQSEEDPCNDNSGNCFGAGSSDSDEDNNVSAPENWDRSISVTLSDPDVFDCCICYEPLSIPIFQVLDSQKSRLQAVEFVKSKSLDSITFTWYYHLFFRCIAVYTVVIYQQYRSVFMFLIMTELLLM